MARGRKRVASLSPLRSASRSVSPNTQSSQAASSSTLSDSVCQVQRTQRETSKRQRKVDEFRDKSPEEVLGKYSAINGSLLSGFQHCNRLSGARTCASITRPMKLCLLVTTYDTNLSAKLLGRISLLLMSLFPS